MTKIRTSNIIRFIILSLIAFLLYFIVSVISINYRIKKHEGKSAFDITSILPISATRITEKMEFYNKDKFIEYDCLIDSIIHIHVVKVGDHFDGDISKAFSFSKKEILVHNDWILQKIGSATPFFLNNESLKYCSFFNVYKLPMNNIESLCIYVNGKILKNEKVSKNCICYAIIAQKISYAFNDSSNADLITSLFGNDPPISYLMVCIDKEKRIYVVNISSIKGDCSPLEKIFG